MDSARVQARTPGFDLPDLLAYKLGISHVILPASNKQLSQECIERLLDTRLFIPSCILLTFESSQEPP